MNSTSLRDAPFVTMVPTGRPWMRKSTTHRCTFLNCDRWMVPRRIENVHLWIPWFHLFSCKLKRILNSVCSTSKTGQSNGWGTEEKKMPRRRREGYGGGGGKGTAAWSFRAYPIHVTWIFSSLSDTGSVGVHHAKRELKLRGTRNWWRAVVNSNMRVCVTKKGNRSRAVQNSDDVSVENASVKEIRRLKMGMMWKQKIWGNGPQLVIGI
jgi:hypothetical protein